MNLTMHNIDKLILLIIMVTLSHTSACGKTAAINPTENILTVLAPTPAPRIQTNLPEDRYVDPMCPGVDVKSGTSPIDPDKAEISFVLKDVLETQTVEVSLLNSSYLMAISKRKCTKSQAFIHLQVEPQDARLTFLAREKTSGRLYVVENVIASLGKVTNYGLIQGTKTSVVKGRILNPEGSELTGEIQELGWKFGVTNDGQWNSGPLPPGQWSIQITDGQNKYSRWLKLPVGSKDVELPAITIAPKNALLTPLWNGVLKSPNASFLINVPAEALELRMSFDSEFMNSFWTPIRQVVNVPVPSSGRHLLYSQFRTFSGEESEIEVIELTAQVLELSSSADAILAESILSVFNPSTKITTVPPEGATHHSVAIDSDEIPSVWTPITSQLDLSMPAQLESCGERIAYIHFKDMEGRVSQTLRRLFFVRCWERDIPTSPLEARYNHGATALSIDNTGDGVFIWGGQNQNNQFFNNGAILKQVSEQTITKPDGSVITQPVWGWQLIATSPLSARSKPKVVAGKNHVLVFGGIAANGDVLGDWAFYNFRTDTWITNTGFDFASLPPPAVKNSSVAFIQAENSNTIGSFLIVGGEIPNAHGSSPEATISTKYYGLIENDGNLEKIWYERNYTLDPFGSFGVSRSNSSVSPQGNLFFVFGGITNPTGTPTTSNPDRSGTDFEANASVLVFAFNATPSGSGNTYTFTHYLYHSPGGKKLSVLHGQSFLVQKAVDSSAPLKTKIESYALCVFGGQKYTDEFPAVCAESRWVSGMQHLYQPFCRRLYDAFTFAPVGRAGICFQPIPLQVGTWVSGYLANLHMAIPGAPEERRLTAVTSPILQGESSLGALFYWSGMAPTGGEYLANGSVFLSREDKWVPITTFESPVPRDLYSSIFLKSKKRIFIWGGLTASGATSGGGFYAMP